MQQPQRPVAGPDDAIDLGSDSAGQFRQLAHGADVERAASEDGDKLLLHTDGLTYMAKDIHDVSNLKRQIVAQACATAGSIGRFR